MKMRKDGNQALSKMMTLGSDYRDTNERKRIRDQPAKRS